jgi:hypothetical protein
METVVVLLFALLGLFCDHESLVQGQITTNFSFPSFRADDDRLLKVADVSFKFQRFAFGILVLEVVSGRRPLARQVSIDPDDVVLLDIVWRAHEGGDILQVADPKLASGGAEFEEEKAVANALHVGLLCCLPNPSERPSMRVVNQWLQGSEILASLLNTMATSLCTVTQIGIFAYGNVVD